MPEKIEKSKLLELIVTDSIPLKKESKIRVLSCAPFVHMVHHNNNSISGKFIM
jgi:ribose-phosphate pyrophosphokinase